MDIDVDSAGGESEQGGEGGTDSDGDGVPDERDAFPNDPDRGEEDDDDEEEDANGNGIPDSEEQSESGSTQSQLFRLPNIYQFPKTRGTLSRPSLLKIRDNVITISRFSDVRIDRLAG